MYVVFLLSFSQHSVLLAGFALSVAEAVAMPTVLAIQKLLHYYVFFCLPRLDEFIYVSVKFKEIDSSLITTMLQVESIIFFVFNLGRVIVCVYINS